MFQHLFFLIEVATEMDNEVSGDDEYEFQHLFFLIEVATQSVTDSSESLT